MSDQKVTPSGLDDPPVNTCNEVNEGQVNEEQVNEEHEAVTGGEVDVEVLPDGMESSALPALLEPQSAVVVAGDDADKSKMECHSTSHSAKDAAYPLFMPLEHAIASLDFDYTVLRIPLRRFLMTLTTCYSVSFLLAIATPTNQIYTQVSALTSALAPTSDSISKLDSTVQFRDIDSVDDIYKWLTDTFIPSVFVSTDHNGDPLPEHLRGRVARTNKVLGGVILEMTPFEFIECHPDLVLTDLYPNCTHTNNAARSINFLDIDMDAEDAKTAVTDLKANGSWVNYQTKQLITTLASYNGIGRTFAVTRLTIDFRETGFIEVKSSIKPIPEIHGIEVRGSMFLLATTYFFLALMYWTDLLLDDAARGKKCKGFVPNLKRVFGILKYIILKYGAAIAFVGPYVRFFTFSVRDELLALADNTTKTPQETYRDVVAAVDVIDTAAFWNNLVSIIGGGVVVQQGLSILQQLRFHPQLNLFALTAMRAVEQFRAFVVIFGIVFLTYAFAGNVLFGGRVLQFSTGRKSLESCVNMVFGDFDYANINKIRASGLYYWSYLIIVSIILLNMMLAIVMGAYDDMSKETYNGRINVLLVSRITQYGRDHFYRFSQYLLQLILWKNKAKYMTKPSDDEQEALTDFEALGFDVRKLTRDDLVESDKILPSFLRLVLVLKLVREQELQDDETPARSSTVVTPSMIRALFPAALLSDYELSATFKHLHEGSILLVDIAKRKSRADPTKQ